MILNVYIRNHNVFVDAVENKNAETLRQAFHLNFDDVGKRYRRILVTLIF